MHTKLTEEDSEKLGDELSIVLDCFDDGNGLVTECVGEIIEIFDHILAEKIKEEREEIVKELHGISCRCLCEKTKAIYKCIELITARNENK